MALIQVLARTTRFAALAAAVPVLWMLCGFNLIGNNKATLTRDASGTATFDLGTEAPEISKKEDYEGGKYAKVDDAQLWPQLVQLALDKWNSVPGISITLKAKASSTASVDSTDLKHAILLSRDLPFSVAASARPSKSDSGSEIIDCDVQVGAGPTPLESLLVTITHEIGHCLGLGHNHVDYSSLMGYSATDRTFRLGLDDMAALIYLYPASGADRSKNATFAPCGSVAGLKGASSAGAFAFLFAPLAFAAFGVRWIRIFQRKGLRGWVHKEIE